MKKRIIGIVISCLLISCGSSNKTSDGASKKEKASNIEKPKAQPVKEEYEEM